MLARNNVNVSILNIYVERLSPSQEEMESIHGDIDLHLSNLNWCEVWINHWLDNGFYILSYVVPMS